MSDEVDTSTTGTSGAYPVSEQITLNVIETLKGVQVANGYRTDLRVERRKRAGNEPKHLLAVVHEGDDVELGDDETPGGMKAWSRPYAIQIFVFTSSLASDDLYHQVLNCARADVERALMAHVDRGGWATNTEIRSPQEFDDPNDAGGELVYLDVTYRHNEKDPYDRVGTAG